MARKRRTVKPPTSLAASEPFQSVEEAWFWFVRCQKARDQGARFERGMELFARPCDPDDIYRAVKTLTRQKLINRSHIRVLHRYGNLERAPDPRDWDEERCHVLWDQALDRLSTVLRSKDIVQ